jgi:hypothetical protein
MSRCRASQRGVHASLNHPGLVQRTILVPHAAWDGSIAPSGPAPAE